MSEAQAGSRSNPPSRPASRPGSRVSAKGAAETERVALQQEYAEQLERAPLDLQNTCGAVLYFAVLAVSVKQESPFSLAYYPENQVVTGDGLVTVPTSGKEASFSSLLLRNEAETSVAAQVRNDITLSQLDDALMLRAAQFAGTSEGSASEQHQQQLDLKERQLYFEVMEFERRSLTRRQVARMLGPDGFPLSASPYASRAVDETEMLTFSQDGLSAPDFYRSHKLLTAHNFMMGHTTAQPNFTGLAGKFGSSEAALHQRRFYRSLPALTLAQLLSSESIKEPQVLKSYYPPTDELLCVLHWPPPDRRVERSAWSPAACLERGSSSSSSSSSRGGSRPNSRAAPARKAGKPFQLDWDRLQQESVLLTPAGDALVLLRRLKSNGGAWLSVHVLDVVLGLRVPEPGTKPKSKVVTSKLVPPTPEEEERARERETPLQSGREADQETGEGGEAGGAEGEGGVAVAAADSEAGAEGKAEGQDGAAAAEDVGGEAGEGEGEGADPLGSASLDSAATGRSRPRADGSLGVGSGPLSEPTWFCHTEDGSRITVTEGPNYQPRRKPDGFGTMCMAVTVSRGLTLAACTDGTVRMTCVLEGVLDPSGLSDPLGVETARVVCRGACVSRTLDVGPYAKDLLFPDGSRVLFNRTPGEQVSSQHLRGFHAKLLREAPAVWTYVHLGASGSVLFYDDSSSSAASASSTSSASSAAAAAASSSSSSSPASGGGKGVAVPGLVNIATTSLDAESKAAVKSFQDGRVLVLHTDGLTEALFPDGTSILSTSGVAALVAKAGLPSVEVDLDIDKTASRHAQGLQVPIAKAGDRVRLRVGLSDGSALFVKYDTRITAAANGSIKLVRRDRTVVTVLDSGVVDFFPRSDWDEEAQAAFDADCADSWTATPASLQLQQGQGQGQPSRGGVVSKYGQAPNDNNNNNNNNLHSHSLQHSVSFADMPPPAAPLSLLQESASFASASASSLPQRSVVSALAPASAQAASSTAPAAERGALRTSYSIDVLRWTARIEDFEYNLFEMDLHSPLEPRVSLAGEVEGLKPVAVTEAPIDPRLFIVQRDAGAVEVVPSKAVLLAHGMAATCPDASAISAPPHSSTFLCRKFTGLDQDLVSFGDIFKPRPWQGRKRPAAASLVARRTSSVASAAPLRPRPRVFQVIEVQERPPLSPEQYGGLEQALERWQAFKRERVANQETYAVADPRSAEEQQEEEALALRLKAAFRAAKTAATKKKTEEHNSASASSSSSSSSSAAAAGAGAGAASAGGAASHAGVGGGYMAHRPPALDLAQSTIDEGNEADDFGDDGEPEAVIVDPMELELADAFEGNSPDGVTLTHSSVRAALVQVLNAHVSQAAVDASLSKANMGLTAAGGMPLRLADFKRVFYVLRSLPLDEAGELDLTTRPPQTPEEAQVPRGVEPLPDWRAQTGPARLQKGGINSPLNGGGTLGAYHKFREESAMASAPMRRKLLKTAPGKQENPPTDFDALVAAEDERVAQGLAQGAGLAAARARK